MRKYKKHMPRRKTMAHMESQLPEEDIGDDVDEEPSQPAEAALSTEEEQPSG